jgi:hypothetical protein
MFTKIITNGLTQVCFYPKLYFYLRNYLESIFEKINSEMYHVVVIIILGPNP